MLRNSLVALLMTLVTLQSFNTMADVHHFESSDAEHTEVDHHGDKSTHPGFFSEDFTDRSDSHENHDCHHCHSHGPSITLLIGQAPWPGATKTTQPLFSYLLRPPSSHSITLYRPPKA